jgi:hypothetical protein
MGNSTSSSVAVAAARAVAADMLTFESTLLESELQQDGKADGYTYYREKQIGYSQHER